MTYIIISELSITINSDGRHSGPGFAVLYSFFYCDDLIFIPAIRQFRNCINVAGNE